MKATIKKLLRKVSPSYQRTVEQEKEIRELKRKLEIYESEMKEIRKTERKMMNAFGWYPPKALFSHYAASTFNDDQIRWFIQKNALIKLKYFPNLDEPKSFNEKTNWMKLHYHNPLITRCIDKVTFKDFVRETIGEGYTPETLAIWNRADDIDFQTLPDRFVLKSTWGSGSGHVEVVTDKSEIDEDRLRFRANTWLQPWENVYYRTYDWGYKDIEPRLLAEEYIEGIEREFKFYCFDGEPRFCVISTHGDNPVGPCTDFYSVPEWEFIPVRRNVKNFPEHIGRPEQLEEMLALSRKLSEPFPHVRVDTILAQGRLLVGELTFYSGSGQKAFIPREWDYTFGEYFNLPNDYLD